MKSITIQRNITPTEEEIQLIQHYSNGLKRKEVAQELKIDVRALDGRLARVITKYNVRTIIPLCVAFYKAGLIK